MRKGKAARRQNISYYIKFIFNGTRFQKKKYCTKYTHSAETVQSFDRVMVLD